MFMLNFKPNYYSNLENGSIIIIGNNVLMTINITIKIIMKEIILTIIITITSKNTNAIIKKVKKIIKTNKIITVIITMVNHMKLIRILHISKKYKILMN